ncbi:MAG TPA: cyclic nucleotide-binding and patatin-like phospholipase domain-containing protein [Burkholderiaceae bacterium]|nr:cyclic nucleotide-binding and patatin-like phospholipase domain-containing protein [Burkholderiaceae bacterium]
MTTHQAAQAPHREALLTQQLTLLLGDAAPAALASLQQRLQWVELAGGELLMEQGESGNSAYLCVSGRLRVYVRDEDGSQRMVREMSRGEVIGEMSLYTGENRSATVVAVRKSVLVRLDKRHFEELLAISPQVSITFTRQIIRRLQTENQRFSVPAPVTISVLPITDDVEVDDFARQLAQQLERFGRVRLIDAAEIDRVLGEVGIALSEEAPADARISSVLDAIEAEHDFVLLVGQTTPGPWTRRCISHGDELLLLARAAQPPAVHAIEQACLTERPTRSEAAEMLVLLHPADSTKPSDTAKWVKRRPVAGYVHLRFGVERDVARLARLLARKAVGLVFAGGGARGFAHLGVWRALHEYGVPIDCVGGTSIGAVLAALVAADPSVGNAIDIARRAFSTNPTGDFNWLPLMSLIKGRRVRAAIDRSITELVGASMTVEDLWKTYFCIATNYSQARQQQIVSGNLTQALLASIAIPGALPPVVHDGDLLCDGGTFNNFPVDVMRDVRGIGTVLGVDLGARNPRRLEFDEMPGGWQLLVDRLRPRSKRRYRVPTLVAYLLNVTILYSTSRQQQLRQLTDVYFSPPLQRVGLLQWSRFDEIVKQGYDHAVEVLSKLSESQRSALGLAPASAKTPARADV